MFWCIPFLNAKVPWEDITTNMEAMPSHSDCQPQSTQKSGLSPKSAAVIKEMVEGTKRRKKMRKQQQQQQQQMAMGDSSRCQHRHVEREGGGLEEEKEGAERKEEEEKEEECWVAEVDRGVLITFVSLPGGGNCIDKIRFREDVFDASEARKWWRDNYEQILELYDCVQRTCPSSLQSDDEFIKIPGISAQESTHKEPTDNSDYDSAVSSSSSRPAPHTTSTEGRHQRRLVIPGKLMEWVVEDQPGVFVTVRSRSNDIKELRRVELSRERFGEVKARVWWEENKDRLHQQYT